MFKLSGELKLLFWYDETDDRGDVDKDDGDEDATAAACNAAKSSGLLP